MPAIAFLPWAVASERFEVGDFVIASFGDAFAHGEIDPSLRDAVDATLAPYAKKRNVDRDNVALVRRRDTTFVVEPDSALLDDLFAFRSRLTFVALASRRFFATRYCNSDHLRLVIQGFDPAQPGGTVITSRRRDGATRSRITKGAWTVSRPCHVTGSCDLPRDIDVPLLTAIEAARSQPMPTWDQVDEAMRLFVGANTDSPDVGLYAEVLDIVSAFSRMADSWDSRATIASFVAELPSPGEFPEHRGPRAANPRFQAQRARGASVRQIWLDDAYTLRSQFGHGRIAGSPFASIWTDREHLLLAAIVFPLYVKARLAAHGLYALSDSDRELNLAFDTLATLEPFSQDSDDLDHPWGAVMMRAASRVLAEKVDY